MPLLLSIIQKFKCQNKFRNKKSDRYHKDTKEKTTCKLVAGQVSTFSHHIEICCPSNFE